MQRCKWDIVLYCRNNFFVNNFGCFKCLSAMNYSVSNTAEFGEYVSGPRIIDSRTKAEMRKVLKDIQSGAFTSEWIRECKAGQPKFKATRRMNDAHPIEEVGRRLRGMMPWIKAKALVDKDRN